MKGLAALRLALVEEAIYSGHFSHVTRSPTLAGVALMSNILTLRRSGHVVMQWTHFVCAAGAHDRQLLDNEAVVEAETALLHTVVRPYTVLSRCLTNLAQMATELASLMRCLAESTSGIIV